MTDEDLFFTHTIVGPALSLHLGSIQAPSAHQGAGLQVNMRNASTSLDRVWKDWILIQGAYPYAGLPRRKPGALRRWIERHALLIGAMGLLAGLGALGVSLVVLGGQRWPIFNI
jgi:hypothetical protein